MLKIRIKETEELLTVHKYIFDRDDKMAFVYTDEKWGVKIPINDKCILIVSEPVNEGETSEANLNIANVTKRTFSFDHCGKAYLDSKNNWVADSITETIKAWDEEHATLLFREMYPGEDFDPPY